MCIRDSPGTGYQPGINTSVSLISPYIVGRDGTANITVSAGGTITAVEIVDGGSAYGVGNTVNVSISMNGQGQSQSQVSGDGLQGLGRSVGNLVQAHLQQEMRPGGLLNPQGQKGRG